MVAEITLKDTVRNTVIFESSDEDDCCEEEKIELYNDYESSDEETDEMLDYLEPYLEEVAKVETIGKKAIKINFLDVSNYKFAKKDEKCDFDHDEDGNPIFPDGSEEFIVPFLLLLSKKNKNLKGYTFETNVNNFKFNL